MEYYNKNNLTSNHNNEAIQNNEINNLNKNKDCKITEFFKYLYSCFKNIITKDDETDDNNKYKLEKKFNETFNFYYENYKNQINYYVENPEISLVGLVNLLNDCYIVSFLQILFHTPNFIKILKKISEYKKEENIIKYLIKVSEFPFNADYFYNLKQLLGDINLEYSKPWGNDSQEFGIELINYIITKTNTQPIEEKEYESKYCNNEKEFIYLKQNIYENHISNYKKNKNFLEELFLFHQINIFYQSEYKKPKISDNLSIELMLQNSKIYKIKIEDLLEQKYNYDNNVISTDPNQIFIKSKLANLPNILIISINRCLSNEQLNNSEIIFNETLDLKKYVDPDLFNINNNKTKYNLYAINECIHFNRMSHNICKIKIDKKWYIFDDEKKVRNIYITYRSNSVIGLFYIKEK